VMAALQAARDIERVIRVIRRRISEVFIYGTPENEEQALICPYRRATSSFEQRFNIGNP